VLACRSGLPGVAGRRGVAAVSGRVVDVAVADGGDEDVDPVDRGEPDGRVGLDESAVVEDGHGEVNGWPVQFA